MADPEVAFLHSRVGESLTYRVDSVTWSVLFHVTLSKKCLCDYIVSHVYLIKISSDYQLLNLIILITMIMHFLN